MTIADLLSKIFRDLFFLFLLTFTAFLLAESLLPGILTRYVSFVTLTILTVGVALCAALFPTGNPEYAPPGDHPLRRPSAIALIIFSTLILTNALLGFPVGAALIIFCIITILFFILFLSFGSGKS
ncbi:MAG TPA: hypothetical protein VJL38_02580 [Patescibacteria group bacterium]|nr:hypothetical protein [Patescibacteria group bacterium]